MPPATLVRWALPPILARMTSCLGPQAFFQRPMISTGIASGSVPENTVQADPFMPGLSSEDFMISTGPGCGREGRDAAAEDAEAVKPAKDSSIAAIRQFIE